MSSSFAVRRDRPSDLARTAAALDPTLAWADGDLPALTGPLPAQPVLLFLPGRSSRGVEVSYQVDELVVRVPALSTQDDYRLAFGLLEVLGEGRMVAPEEGDPIPAAQVRERFGGEWVVRDMAVGIVGLQSALATGSAVTVVGPVNQITFDPGFSAGAIDVVELIRKAQDGPPVPRRVPRRDAWDQLIDELSVGLDEHRDALDEAERAEAPATAAPPVELPRLWWLGLPRYLLPLLPFIVVIVVVGLVVRLITVPFRNRIGAWQDNRRDAARRAQQHEVLSLPAGPRRAELLVALGETAIAERELTACLRDGETGALRWARAHARQRLLLRHLSDQDVARARQLGFAGPPRPSLLRRLPGGAAGWFVAIAGLDPS